MSRQPQSNTKFRNETSPMKRRDLLQSIAALAPATAVLGTYNALASPLRKTLGFLYRRPICYLGKICSSRRTAGQGRKNPATRQTRYPANQDSASSPIRITCTGTSHQEKFGGVRPPGDAQSPSDARKDRQRAPPANRIGHSPGRPRLLPPFVPGRRRRPDRRP